MKAGSLVISDPYSRCCPNSLSCCPADQRRQTKDWWSKLTVAATVESHFASIYYTAVTVAGVMCESEGEDKARDHLWGAPTTRNVLFSVICLLRLSLLLIMWLVCVCVFIRAMQQGHVRRDTSSTSKPQTKTLKRFTATLQGVGSQRQMHVVMCPVIIRCNLNEHAPAAACLIVLFMALKW